MGHPHLSVIFNSIKQAINMLFISRMSLDREVGVAILSFLPSENVFPAVPRKLLQTVTYAQYRDTKAKES